MVGLALARSIAAPQVEDRDQLGVAMGKALTSRGLATISRGSDAQAQLVIVVAAEATEPRRRRAARRPRAFDVALKARAAVVVAGPNSAGIEGTDVLAVRSDPQGSRPAQHGRRRRPDQRRDHHGAGRPGAAERQRRAALRGAGQGRRAVADAAGALSAPAGPRRGRRRGGGAGGRAGQPAVSPRRPPVRTSWIRTNHAGATVTLAEGPSPRPACSPVVAARPGRSGPPRRGGGPGRARSGLVGAFDDLYGAAQAKGFRGHLAPSGRDGDQRADQDRRRRAQRGRRGVDHGGRGTPGRRPLSILSSTPR